MLNKLIITFILLVSDTFVQDSSGAINENPMEVTTIGVDTPDIAPFRYRNESIAPSIPLIQKATSGNASDKVGHLEPSSPVRRPVSIIKKTAQTQQLPPMSPIRLSSIEHMPAADTNGQHRASIFIEDLQLNTYGQESTNQSKIVTINPPLNNNNNITNNIRHVESSIVSPNSSETVSSSDLHNIDSNEDSGNDIIDDENDDENLNEFQLKPQQQQQQQNYGVRNIIVNSGDTRASTLPSKRLFF